MLLVMSQHKLSSASFAMISVIVLVLCMVHHSKQETWIKPQSKGIKWAPPNGDSKREWYKQYAIAADSEICGQVGKSILQQNGSVVDAGIATLFCTGVVDQPHMGVGGGTLLLVHERPNTGGDIETVYISADDRAPLWVTPETNNVVNNDWPYSITRDEDNRVTKWNTFRNIAIGVPGEVAGYFKAWERYGRLPWNKLVEPAIKLARNGFKISPVVKKTVEEYQLIIKLDQGLTDMFSKLSDPFISHAIGDVITDDVLAETLEAIAEDPMSFYKGKLAEKISADVKDMGGQLSKEDLKNYQPRLLQPYKISMKGGKYTGHVPPQPFGGALIVFVYNIIQEYNMTLEDVSTKEGFTLFYHRFIEAWKFAYGHVSCIGDDYMKFDICTEAISNLLNTDYAKSVIGMIDDKKVQDNVENYQMVDGDSVTAHGTSHLSIVNEDGTAFMATSSINTEYGCKKKGTRTGIIFNDRLTDFSQKNGGFSTNLLGPDKQGRSFRTPLLVTDSNGKTVLAVGGSGGQKILTSLLQDVIFHLHFGMDMKTAVDSPRMVIMPSYPAYPIFHDHSFKDGIIEKMRSMGHSVLNPIELSTFLYTGVTQGVSMLKCQTCDGFNCDKACMETVSDYRKGGSPAGV